MVRSRLRRFLRISLTTSFRTWFSNWDNLTLGDVWYLDEASAFQQRLAYNTAGGQAVIRVDNTSNVAFNEKRNSVSFRHPRCIATLLKCSIGSYNNCRRVRCRNLMDCGYESRSLGMFSMYDRAVSRSASDPVTNRFGLRFGRLVQFGLMTARSSKEPTNLLLENQLTILLVLWASRVFNRLLHLTDMRCLR